MNDLRRKAEEIMMRGDAVIAERNRRKAIIMRSAALGLGAAAIVGVGICANALKPPKKPTADSSAIIAETTAATSAETTAKTSVQSEKGSSGSVGTTKTKAAASETAQSGTQTSPAYTSTVKSSGNAAAPVKTQLRTTAPSSEPTSVHSAANTQTPVTQPVTTEITTTERSKDMKKIISLLSAAAMVTPVTAYNASAEGYKDPAEKYATNIYYYYEPANAISPAEQELFNRIDKGLIDIDIDRNGELDMRDAALLYTYDMWNFVHENPELVKEPGYEWLKTYQSFEFKAPSEEAAEFLESREEIRDTELFSKTRHYINYGNMPYNLDADLITRYHLTHTLKPEYFDSDYYNEYKNAVSSDAIGKICTMRNYMSNIIRESYFTDLDPLYDVNADGTFDLHDVQDFLIFFVHCDYRTATYHAIRETKPYNLAIYAPYPEDEQSISETVWNNCIKLCNADAADCKKLDILSEVDFLNHDDMMKIFFARNSFKLIYLEPEYFIEKRPGNEGMPIDDDLVFSDIVKDHAANNGLITSKLGFSDAVFGDFYTEWSTAVDNGTVSLPDIDADGAIDAEDFAILESYESEVFSNTPAEYSTLPAELRSWLDNEFDINGNGISGDLYDIMAVKAYFIINYPEYTLRSYSGVSENVRVSINIDGAKEVTLAGDANCDKNVTVADAVAVMQFIGNRDKYTLSDQGKMNADVDGVEGITANDALMICQWDSQGKL